VTRIRTLRSVSLLLAVSAVVLAGPVTGASASKASIKTALNKGFPLVRSTERAAVEAISAYKTTHEPAAVDAALAKAITALKAVKSKVAAQPAGRPAVKLAKSKLLKGISAIVLAYEHLGTAFEEKGTDPSAAEAEASTAVTKIKAGNKQVKEAVKLLS
jgi:poly-gamma-glutamate capsule biosynthesis protein CapA/YwtB (metallophosphatase superfamily)